MAQMWSQAHQNKTFISLLADTNPVNRQGPQILLARAHRFHDTND